MKNTRCNVLLFNALLAALIFVAFFPAVSLGAAASSVARYPVAAVTIYLPAPEGDQAEIPLALAAPFFARHSALPVTLRHIPGRGGSYAWQALANAPNNGLTAASLHFPSMLMQAKPPENIFADKEIAPLLLYARLPVALWVMEKSPWAGVRELAEKAEQQPGAFAIGGSGSATAQHAAHLMFNRASGLQALYIPFTGSQQCVAAAKNNTVAACWGYALTPESMPGMRAIAIASDTRAAALPATPTFREQRLAVIADEYLGIGLPAGVSESTRAAAADFFESVLGDPAFVAALRHAGLTPALVPYEDMEIALIRLRSALDSFLQQYPLPGKNP